MILSIVLIMIFYRSRKKFDGELFLIYTLLYAIGRFVTENYRGDDARGFLFNGAITHSQFIALLLIIAAGILYFLGWKSKRKVVFP
jgi:phosphatidylglycerol:prolipoprotein diacylglycerol transferase